MSERIEYELTKEELRPLVKYWFGRKITHNLWWFIYQTTSGMDLQEKWEIDQHLNRLAELLGEEDMQKAADDTVKSYCLRTVSATRNGTRTSMATKRSVRCCEKNGSPKR